MKCEDCGFEMDSNSAYQIKMNMVICHVCGKTYSMTVIGRYWKDIYYPNGMKTHLMQILPYECPHCGITFSGHEFYCGYYRETTNEEALQSLSLATHPRKEETEIEIPECYQETLKKLGIEQ